MNRAIGVALIAMMLSACKNPYALDVQSVNLDEKQQAGVIQFTDPKLYKREALINERRNETAYLKSLLAASEKSDFDFQPEIVRELEVTQAFSATASAKFDPAAAANFERQTELADLKHEIELARLGMQLAQLKRDAELQKTELEKQSEPSAPAGEPAEGGAEAVTSDIQATDAQALIDKIETLRGKLETRLAADVPKPKKASAVAGPIDKFNDLAAYRSVLKSAMNAVSLDELHDKDGNSLFRVQLKSTVLPHSKSHLDTLGILRMEIGGPDWENDTSALKELYFEWLQHVNRNVNVSPDPRLILPNRRIRTSPTFTILGVAGRLYFIVLLELPKLEPKDEKPAGNEGSGTKKEKTEEANAEGAKPTKDKTSERPCEGIQRAERNLEKCWYIRIALPIELRNLEGFLTFFDEAVLSPDVPRDNLLGAQQSVQGRIDAFGKKLSPDTFKLNEECTQFLSRGDPLAAPILLDRPILLLDPETVREGRRGFTPQDALNRSRAIYHSWPYVATVIGFLSDIEFGVDSSERMIPAQLMEQLEGFRQIYDAAGAFLLELALQNTECAETFFGVSGFLLPDNFELYMEKIRARSRVTVYDVAPTERAKRVSTVARAADAVALAAAVAGQIPGYGLGLSGNIAYSRSAIGKADAIERAPLVVGFAEPGEFQPKDGNSQSNEDSGTQSTGSSATQPSGSSDTQESGHSQTQQSGNTATTQNGNSRTPPLYPAFGWLLGPDIGLVPKEKKLVLTQRVRPYDLYADLSLPGWWPYFRLKAYTAWAPNWRLAKDGDQLVHDDGATAKRGVTGQAFVRIIEVPMAHNAADMDGLTTLLLEEVTGQRVAHPFVASVQPEKFSACANDLHLEIRGENLWRASLVHIGGLAVKESDIEVLPDMRGVLVKITAKNIPRIDPKVNSITVWTKDGPAKHPIEFEDVRKTDGTCKPRAKKSDGPVITSVAPAAISVCDTNAVFTVQGKNLGGAQSAVLGTLKTTDVDMLPPANKPSVEVRFSTIQGPTRIGQALSSLTLAVRTPAGVATKDIQVAHSECP
jgi:hypothetical protein